VPLGVFFAELKRGRSIPPGNVNRLVGVFLAPFEVADPMFPTFSLLVFYPEVFVKPLVVQPFEFVMALLTYRNDVSGSVWSSKSLWYYVVFF
jgi:hypothetical protein